MILLSLVINLLTVSQARSRATPNSNVEARQSIPTNLPGAWHSIGCYTDSVNSRTLRAAGYSSSTSMTVEACVDYCDSRNYPYAGVEYGGECYCDVVTHSGVGTDPSECNMACTGNSQELCGGSNRLNMFYTNVPDPSNPPSLGESLWRYSGCYIDSISQRTLPYRTSTSGPVTPESCANACRDAGHAYMGLEYGNECWCGDNISSSLLVSDSECLMTCDNVPGRTFYCGGSNRLTVYNHLYFFPGSYPTFCLPSPYPNFTLTATYKEPPISGPRSYPLKVVDALTIPGTTWSVLSACPSCPTSYNYFQFINGAIFPRSSSNPNIPEQITSDLWQGYSPIFATRATLPPDYGGYAGYCEMSNPYVAHGANVLCGNSRPDTWALCRNLTASGRLDVVLEPRLNNNHYDRRDCGAVDIYIGPAN